MSIKIIGHPSLASDLYVKMSQVIQEIDMLPPGPLSAILIQETPYDKKEKFHWKTFTIGG